jgi:long-chain acyl-CoA synthetase
MNLASMIEGHIDDRVALISRNRETTYGQLRDQVARLRGGLDGLGVGDGDRVAIVCGNNRYFVISYLAVIGLGAVAVPLNPLSPSPAMQKELNEINPTTVVVGPSARHAWDAIDRAEVATITNVITAEGDARPGAIALSDLLASEPVPLREVEPDHLAVLVFTSGTAGRSHAAMLTHRNLASNIQQSQSAADGTRAGDVVYGVLPLFHIFGLNVVLGVSLSVGATVLLVQQFDPATAIQSIIQRGVTVVPGVPPMWIAFSHFEELPADAFSSVRLALSGASRLPPHVAEQMNERFGVRVLEGYGLTEASPVVTSSAGAGFRPGSVGRVLAGQEVRLVGSHGEDVPVGDSGEVWVRGDNIFVGYLDDPETTDRVLVDGWLRTGDIGVADADGFLYLVNRAKDLIIVSGFNVFPAEVEEVLAAHPSVADVAVLGVPHPHDGEAVKAFVVPRPGAEVDEDTLIEHCRDFLARYKCPSKLVFVDQLPRNAAGKVIRRELEGTILA